MKCYIGVRLSPAGAAGPCLVEVTDTGEDADRRPLDPRYDLRRHSPDGFTWGYSGSGPAQLALAILAEHLGDGDVALGLYQRFKARVVANLDGDRGWKLTAAEIDQALEGLGYKPAGDLVGEHHATSADRLAQRRHGDEAEADSARHPVDDGEP